jgi:hypothetical protein
MLGWSFYDGQHMERKEILKAKSKKPTLLLLRQRLEKVRRRKKTFCLPLFLWKPGSGSF